jgi:hypothetical protein
VRSPEKKTLYKLKNEAQKRVRKPGYLACNQAIARRTRAPASKNRKNTGFTVLRKYGVSKTNSRTY